MGRPTVTVVSRVFMPLAKGEKDAFGFPDLPVVVVPHPVGTRPDEELRRLGRELVPEIVRALSQG